MGFALWIDGDIAWAQGTHEYRPMGTAVIATTDLFRRRDFNCRDRKRPRNNQAFVGLFASLEHVNHFLARRRLRPTAQSPSAEARGPSPETPMPK